MKISHNRTIKFQIPGNIASLSLKHSNSHCAPSSSTSFNKTSKITLLQTVRWCCIIMNTEAMITYRKLWVANGMFWAGYDLYSQSGLAQSEDNEVTAAKWSIKGIIYCLSASEKLKEKLTPSNATGRHKHPS